MSSIHNLSSLIAKKSRELADAKAREDWDEADRLEDELENLQEELEEEEELSRDGRHGWN